MKNVSFLFPVAAQVDSHQAVISSRWLGEWGVHWKNNLGERLVGNSRLSRPIEDGLLKEELRADSTGSWDGWRGISFAKFNLKNQTWHYTWQDNQGRYCDFIGHFTKGIFSLQYVDANGMQVKQRMIIRALNSKRVVWECEDHSDKIWRKSWKVEYRRN